MLFIAKWRRKRKCVIDIDLVYFTLCQAQVMYIQTYRIIHTSYFLELLPMHAFGLLYIAMMLDLVACITRLLCNVGLIYL